jgi:hypothetical protein
MKKYMLSLAVALVFCVAATVSEAQGTMGGAQGTSPSSPSGMHQGTNTSPAGQNDPMAGPNQTGNDNTNQTGNMNSDKNNGEKKLKGCVQSQGGQYVLETKKGKMVNLSGQDVSAHVGHEVQVKGTWASGSMSQSSTGTAGEKTLNVTDVKMISDTCGGKNHDHSSSGMGPGANGNNPQGTGSGTGSQPPQ